MRLHPDMKFTLAAVTAFTLVAVLLPMSMVMTGCHMMAIDSLASHMPGSHITGICDMVQDPALPDSSSPDGGITLLLSLIVALALAFTALFQQPMRAVRAIVPVAAAPPPEPPEPPLGERLRL